MDRPNLTNDKSMRDLIRLAWPVFVAQVAVMANGLIDTLMAGHLSSIDLAAVGIGAAIYASLFISVTGILLALSPTVAHLQGGRRYEEIGEQVRQAAWLAGVLAVLTIALLTFPEPLLAIAQLTPEVASKVQAYLDAMAWGAPAALFFRVFYGFSAGISRPRPVMVLNLLGLGLKLPLNWIFMHGQLGLPPLGAAGCGVASSLIAWLLAILSWIWCYRQEAYRPYGLFSRWSWPEWTRLAALARLGLPIGATFLVDVTAFTFMALFIARFGPVASGAHQIASSLAALVFMLPTAIGHAAAVLAGQALGRSEAGAARLVGLRGLQLGLGCALILATLIAFGNKTIASLYTHDSAVQALTGQLLLLVALYHLADALQAVAVYLLRSYRKTAIPMLIYALALWGVGLGGGVMLGLGGVLGPARGPSGFWWAAIAGLWLAGFGVGAYWWHIANKATKDSTQ